MLKDLLNKEVVIRYVLGYTYATKKGVVTKVNVDFLTIDNNTLISTKAIVKVIFKNKK